MDFIVIAILIIALLFITSNLSTGQAASRTNTNPANKFFEDKDDIIIDEIIKSKEISRIELEQLPWSNRKYKRYSSKSLNEMHEKFMAAASAARISKNEEKASALMNKVGDINAESMIRRHIHIQRIGREPININDSSDKIRLDQLLEGKMKNYQYKIQTDDGHYNFNYESIINEQIKTLQIKYKILGYDESSSNLRAKCELLNIKLKPEHSASLA